LQGAAALGVSLPAPRPARTAHRLPEAADAEEKISVAGAWGSTRQELTEVLDLIAAGRISSVLEEISLDEVPEGYEHLHRGDIPGRLVAMMGQ
jgi:D-arabinose 1-dehydrogenase-like Zn-dependent alcohol dehydrogenase